MALCLLLLAGLSVIVTGCSSDNSGQSTAGVLGTGTTTTLPDFSEPERELVKTYEAQHKLADYLTEQKAADDDPRMGVLYGLRARTQALSCLDALDSGFLEVADSAMLNVFETITQAQAVATGTVAQTLADARAFIASLGAPSYSPGVTVTLLDQFVAELAPLLDEATVVLSAPTTLSSTTST
jgi:hypothetical protein